jgi:hypothetical protein
MSEAQVIEFLHTVAARADLLDSLKVRSKDEVLAAAAELGFSFTEAEFDPLIWGLEDRLAASRAEKFDQHFALWETMWGKYYLDYLVTDLIPALEETGLLPQA